MICRCTVASSAVVGSSATSSVGRHASAMAIITRCAIPPLSWCGIRGRAVFSGSVMPTSPSARTISASRARRWRGYVGPVQRASTSPICRRTVSTGLSEVIGSWKTYAICPPRTARNSRSGKPQQIASL